MKFKFRPKHLETSTPGSVNRGNPLLSFRPPILQVGPAKESRSRLQPKSHSQKTGNLEPEAAHMRTSQLLRFNRVFSLGHRALLADHGLDLKISMALTVRQLVYTPASS